MEEKAKSKPEHLLMDAIDFTEEDLEANREGQMTARQLRNLSRQWNLRTCFTVLLALFICPLVLIIGLAQLRNPTFSATTIIAAIFLAFPVYLVYKWWQLSMDLRQRAAASVEGRVRLDLSAGKSGGAQLTVAIDKTNFRVNKPVFLSFKNGDPYCIYYTPRSKTMLSAEWLREG